MLTKSYKIIILALIIFQIKSAEVEINFALLPKIDGSDITQEMIDNSKRLLQFSPLLWNGSEPNFINVENDDCVEYIQSICDTNNPISNEAIRFIENCICYRLKNFSSENKLKLCTKLGGFFLETINYMIQGEIKRYYLLINPGMPDEIKDFVYLSGVNHLAYASQKNFLRFLNKIFDNKFISEGRWANGSPYENEKFNNQSIDYYLCNNFTEEQIALIKKSYNIQFSEKSCCSIQ